VRAIAGLTRWRHNPLRRRTDLAEAWVALVTALLIAVVAPVAGVLAGVFTDHAIEASIRAQHRERHRVAATVERTLSLRPADPDPETVPARAAHSSVTAVWQAPDGTVRHGTVAVGLYHPHPGDHVRIWTDRHGSVVAPPLGPLAAQTHAVLAGTGAAVVAAGCLEAVRRLVMWRMVQRRYAQWDRAWEKAGPDWGRTGTGS
jgi:hypothetical protein